MWTDQVDQANDLAQRERDAMAQMRKPTLPRIGRCHACNATVPPEALFCDEECQDMWSTDQKMAQIRGQRR